MSVGSAELSQLLITDSGRNKHTEVGAIDTPGECYVTTMGFEKSE